MMLIFVFVSSLPPSLQANAFRNSHRIYVSGADIPDAVESFQVLCSSYSLPPYILKNVIAMGYNEPTPIQMQAIPLMLQVNIPQRVSN